MANDKKNTTFSGFAKYLFDNKILNEEDIVRSLSSSSSFIDDIYYQKYMLENELAWAIAHYNKYTYLDLNYYSEKLITLDLDLNWIRQNRILPLKIKKDTLFIILDNPAALSKAFIDLKEKYQVKNIITFVGERLKLNRLIESLIMLKQNPNYTPTKDDEKNIYTATKQTVEQVEHKVDNKKDSSESLIKEVPEVKKQIENTDKEVKNKIRKDTSNMEKEKNMNQDANTLQVQNGAVSENETDQVITKYIQRILIDAVNSEVNEIHFEPYEKHYRIRFKQYGDLYEAFVAPQEIKDYLSKKIKSISNMEVDNTKPQFGKFSLKISEVQNIDFKALSCPTIYGEKIVLHIVLDSMSRLSFDNLGYNREDIDIIKTVANKNPGLCIFSGPVNSGKTFSMYNMLGELNKKNKNIYTIEEVVGFNLSGANQLRVGKDISYEDILVFIKGQSPDAILVDNIDNQKVAQKVWRIAQTGTLVASGLNSTSIKDVFIKLFAMGFSAYDIASTVKIISAQRLLPKICPDCKQRESITKSMLLKKGFSEDDLEGLDVSWKLYSSMGCSACNHTGHKGVEPVFDILKIDDEIKDLLLNSSVEDVFYHIESRNKNLKTLTIEKIKKGIISLNTLEDI